MRLTVCAVILVGIAAGQDLSQPLGKPVIDLPIAGSALTPGQQLQQAVNDPANAGVILRLARGSYVLDPAGPNARRLVFQQGMEIMGENQYVDCDGDGVYDPIDCSNEATSPNAQFTLEDSETLIDGSAIIIQEPVPGTSRTAPTGIVRVGRDNSVAHVTIRGNTSTNAIGTVHIDLRSEDGVIGTVVTDSILEGGLRGIYCTNPQGLIDGTSGLATVKRNILRNNSVGGFVIQNANTDGNTWEATLQYNRICNNTVGVLAVENQSALAETTIASTRNLIDSNRLGILLMSGQDQGGMRPPGTARGGMYNSLSFISHEDTIQNNSANLVGLQAPYLGGGVLAMAGANITTNISASSGNGLVLHFLNTRFKDNFWMPDDTQPGYLNHVRVFGYWTHQDRDPATGTYNAARVRVRLPNGDDQTDGFWLKNSVPVEPAGMNKAVVVNSNVAFKEMDAQGFPSE